MVDKTVEGKKEGVLLGQNQNPKPGQQLSALAHGLGARRVGLGPRCCLRAVMRLRTERSLALARAARSRTAHHNSDPPSRRSVRSTSDQSYGFSRRTTGVVLRTDASGDVLARTPRVCVYARGADRPPHRFFDVAFEHLPPPAIRLARALAKIH